MKVDRDNWNETKDFEIPYSWDGEAIRSPLSELMRMVYVTVAVTIFASLRLSCCQPRDGCRSAGQGFWKDSRDPRHFEFSVTKRRVSRSNYGPAWSAVDATARPINGLY